MRPTHAANQPIQLRRRFSKRFSTIWAALLCRNLSLLCAMLALSSTVVVSYVQQPLVRAAAGVRSPAVQMNTGKGDEFTLAILGDLHVRTGIAPPPAHTFCPAVRSRCALAEARRRLLAPAARPARPRPLLPGP